MKYSCWDTPIEQLLAEDGQISERASTSPKPTSDYITRVRVSHENAGVPPNSPFEDARELYMGERYPEVPESWEDRPTDLSTEATLSTLASTQAGEDMVELYTGTLEVNQVHPPVSVATCSLCKTSLDSFLPILGHTPSLAKKSHPPDTSPSQNLPSKK